MYPAGARVKWTCRDGDGIALSGPIGRIDRAARHLSHRGVEWASKTREN